MTSTSSTRKAALDRYANRTADLFRVLEGETDGGPLAVLRRVFREVAANAVPGDRGW